MCSNSLFPKRKLLEDSFDEGEGKSYMFRVVVTVVLSPGLRLPEVPAIPTWSPRAGPLPH